MNHDALKAAAKESVIEAAKLIPLVGVLIEGVRGYRDTIEEEQQEAFVNLLASRIENIENGEWFSSEQGKGFTKKVVATALNAEYSDKLEFLAVALTNGPTLGDDDAMRMKFVDFIRSLSKPSLDALVAFAGSSSAGTQVLAGNVAKTMNWKPDLANACIQELHSLGVYSSVTSWRLDRYSETYEVNAYFSDGRCAPTEMTEQFVRFISSEC